MSRTNLSSKQVEEIVCAAVAAAISEITQIASEAAARVVIDIWHKKKKEHEQEQYNAKLWNTRTLLRHYRALKKYTEQAVYDRKSAAAVTESLVELLENIEACNSKQYIESIKSSVLKTKIIMAHIDTMLRVYKVYCETSDKPEDLRRYEVLHAHYLAEKKTKIEDICKWKNIDKSTFHRDNNESSELLTALIFGVDGVLAMRHR